MSVKTEFKVGDRVELSADSKWATGQPSNPLGVVGEVDIVGRAGRLDVHVQWPNGNNSYPSADLFLAVDERQALSDATDLCNKYGVSTPINGPSHYNYIRHHTGPFTNEQVLDKLFPPTPAETTEQTKLKELEEKQLLIADEMKKLRESMG